jgi:restriction endonuclease Mrr
LGSLTFLWAAVCVLGFQAFTAPDSLGDRLANWVPGLLPWLGGTLTFTLAMVWTGLAWVIQQEQGAPVTPLVPAELLTLDPTQFERHVALVLRHRGFRVRQRGGSGDHGVDLEVYPSSGRKGIVQCKRYRSTVGERTVRDLYGTMLHEDADHAFLVTAGEISASARVWAEGKPITLVDGERLWQLAVECAR